MEPLNVDQITDNTTKNDEGRVFPITTALRTLLEQQFVEHEKLQRNGTNNFRDNRRISRSVK